MAKKVLKGIKQELEGSFSAETGYLYLVRKSNGGGYVQLDNKIYGEDVTWEKGSGSNSVVLKGGNNWELYTCCPRKTCKYLSYS